MKEMFLLKNKKKYLNRKGRRKQFLLMLKIALKEIKATTKTKVPTKTEIQATIKIVKGEQF